MQGLRRTYGIAEPVRREMELKDVRMGDAIGASFLQGKGPSVGEDVLGGKESEIGGWEGIFGGRFKFLLHCVPVEHQGWEKSHRD